MGKVGSTSWLTAVKKVFRSPTKSSPKKNCKRREEYTQEDEEDTKKTEKRRWIFRKLTNHNQQEEAGYEKKMESISMEEQKRAIAAAEASTAAAKAAVATAHAAVRFQEIIPAYLAREYYAALIIQTSFRGYLARRALRALKGIVKLQALVRGTNIRKQAKATLKCMQTLIRVQTQLRHQSFSRPLSQGSIRKSMYAETNNLWDKYKHIHQRKSVSGNEEYIEDESKKQSYTIEDIEAMVQTKKQASLHREQALAYALSQQIRRFERKKCSRDEMVEQDKDTEWLSHWLDSKEYIDNNTIDDAIKNVDMESLHPPLMTPPSHLHRSRHHQDPPPYRRQSLHTPRPLHNTRPLGPVQVQSASPRYARTQSAATTPSLRASRSSQSSTTPNYMAATESAKARARTQSTPRQRHSTSDRERVASSSVKKRLSFPIPEEQYPGRIYTDEYSCCLSQNLRSPSFRSVQEGLYYYYSSNTDFATGEVSPASTSHLRNTRWIG